MSTLAGRSGAFPRLAALAAVAALLVAPAIARAASTYPYDPPIFDVAPPADVTVAEGGSLDIPVHAYAPNPWPYDGVLLHVNIKMPPFATLESSGGGGTLHIRPMSGDAGVYSDAQVVAFGDGGETIAAITIAVTNHPPVLDPIVNQTVAEGSPLDIPVTASDPDGDPVTISKGTLPAFATLTDNHNGTAKIHLAPGYSDAGTYSHQTVRVYDGTAYGATVAFDITVTNVNRPPVLDLVPPQTVAEGATRDVQLTATDPDGDPITISKDTLPAFATLTDHHDGTATIHLAPGYSAAGTYSDQTVDVYDGTAWGAQVAFDITVTNTDTAAPVVTVPGDKTVEATGPAGAAVTYAPSAIDDIDGPMTPTCAPVSGSTFVLGHTTVTCTATDSDGHTGSASFAVTVTDTTAPSITEPGGDPLLDITVPAASGAGARVTFTAGATDTVDATVAPTCRPASGHLFPIGRTRVTCSATDASGNTGSASFQVTVTSSTQPVPSQPETSTTAPSPAATRDTGSLPVVLAGLGSLIALAALGRRRRASR